MIKMPEDFNSYTDVKDILMVKDWLDKNGYEGEYTKNNRSAVYFKIVNAQNGNYRDIKIPRGFKNAKAVSTYMNDIIKELLDKSLFAGIEPDSPERDTSIKELEAKSKRNRKEMGME